MKKVTIPFSTIHTNEQIQHYCNNKLNMKTILVVDDNIVNRKLLCKILSNDHMTIEAEDGENTIAILNKYEEIISAVILDLVMPNINGYEFLTLIHYNLLLKNIPIVVITENGDSENEIKALKCGAWDFVTKPYNPDIIRFRLNNVITRSQFTAFKQLKYISEYDALTGVYNKKKFFEVTHEMLVSHPNKDFAFVRFDIDRFKLINTFFGMQEGDRLLKYIASELKRFSLGNTLFTYGRIEADVFCICLAYDENTAKLLLATARETLENYDLNYSIVPSFGIYIVEDKELPVHAMFDMATLASKQCKESYVEFYSIYNDVLSETLIREQEITNEMDFALENGQFQLYLQPKYNLKTGLPNGAETLVRWIHPVKGIISPNDFIPLFERNGFISKLDFYIWEKACQLIKHWIDSGYNPLPISVNVSRVNLYNPKLENTLINLVKKYDIPPYLLNLELTESAYTDNPAIIKMIMTRLHKYGFIVMMDDFGSGYSSLNVLKDIHIDILKLDMKFLSNNDNPERGESILSSIIEMAHKLNITVIAEGVETESQATFLNNVGCDHVQGFYFAKPMPIDNYEELIKIADLKGRT